MNTNPYNFVGLQAAGFDYAAIFHADAILHREFMDAAKEIEEVLLNVQIPIGELVRSGGGKAKVTQRMGSDLAALGWTKRTFNVSKLVDDTLTLSTTHEIDHVKKFPKGTLALEIEWNNKDPFFDRDLENFSRLQADGVISLGIIITRGRTFQSDIEERIAAEGRRVGIRTIADLEQVFDLTLTKRQRGDSARWQSTDKEMVDEWARSFSQDKFGQSTTHWNKLVDRFKRGVGAPCPVVALGLPIGVVQEGR